jgi:LmbE family N-acetylglucosaminyl deacetylase
MKILATFAHPDDESYGPGGTLAQATRSGHIVSLLTLTHGESGSLGISKDLSTAELANLRRQELKCAAKKLGVQHLQIHSLPDKQLSAMPEQKGIDIIEQKIKRFKPDIIITYHENTISGHPDHLAVTNWTLNAVKSLKNPPRLFFFGLDQEQTSMVTFRRLIPIRSSEVTHRINVKPYIEDKIAAIQCHKTQNAAWHQFEKMKTNFKTFAKWEVFVQKWPKPEDTRVKYDLFES